MTGPIARAARFDQLTVRQLHDLLRLRVDVFVVEQDCPYPEIDGRDTDPATEHLWVEVDGEVAACLRILDDGVAARIGRVATAQENRGHGYAAQLMRMALGRIGDRPTVLEAQAYLEEWYGRFGFERAGEDYLEDGILHVPMVRAAPSRSDS